MKGLDETEVRVLRSCASTEDNFDTFADEHVHQRMHRRGLVSVSIVVVNGDRYARYEITELGRLALRVNHQG